jgi:hypothetical protein
MEILRFQPCTGACLPMKQNLPKTAKFAQRQFARGTLKYYQKLGIIFFPKNKIVCTEETLNARGLLLQAFEQIHLFNYSPLRKNRVN